VKRLVIGPDGAGQRLDRYVKKAFPGLPLPLLHKLVREKDVKINRKRTDPAYRLVEGDVLEIYADDSLLELRAPKRGGKTAQVKINIVYEDDNILIIDKPAGLLAHEDDDYNQPTAVGGVLAYLRGSGQWDPGAAGVFTPALCNRIDRNTGGLVIAAKNAEALRDMNARIKNRAVRKLYLLIVHGRPSPASGELTGYIEKDEDKSRVYVHDRPRAGAKSAQTLYRVLQSRGGLSLVECELITGRTHQIRAQMARAGYPLLGDGKYGRNELDRKYTEKSQALYSYKLIFTPPGYADSLTSLDGREFTVDDIGFVKKYFAD